MFFGKKMVEIYHGLLEESVHEGDAVIDGTVGNGFDTEFLCRLVGECGCVHGFDIQPEALEHTRTRLEAAGLTGRAKLHLASHDLLDTYVHEPVAAFCFNLGYLPEGNPEVITKPSTTVPAIQKALEALISGGIGCVLAYYGHEGGRKEKEYVDEMLQALPPKKYEVFRLENHNRAHQPPILYLVKKLR